MGVTAVFDDTNLLDLEIIIGDVLAYYWQQGKVYILKNS
jgi:hypothetical protein